MANIAQRANAGDLKTDASWWDQNGRSFKAAGEWFKEHWLIGFLSTLIAIAVAGYKIWNA